jgi:hypothetical protein
VNRKLIRIGKTADLLLCNISTKRRRLKENVKCCALSIRMTLIMRLGKLD